MEPTMQRVKVLVAAKTDVGRVRTNNEDSFTIADIASGAAIDAVAADQHVEVPARGLLLALSDGMGGHQAGEIASALVLDGLRAVLRQHPETPTHLGLEHAIRRVNADVFEAAKNTNKKGMGATLTALLVEGRDAYLAQVGDSRAYLLRDGRLRQLSRDQSLVQLLVDGGAMTPEEAKHAPQKNVILQAMGLARDVRAAVSRLQLRRGDTVLLCCDGLSNAISDDELAAILGSASPSEACARAIALANERGGEDNLTAIVARFDGDSLAAPDRNVTATFEILTDFVHAPKPQPAQAEPRRPLEIPNEAVAEPPLREQRSSPRRSVGVAVAVVAAIALAIVLLAVLVSRAR